MSRLADLLRTVLGPGEVERLLHAQERQAAALERLVQLGEFALQVDPQTVALQMELAQAQAVLDADATKVVVHEYKPQDLLDLEALITNLGTSLGRLPTDDEIEQELERQQAASETAQLYAALHSTAAAVPGGLGSV